MARPKKTKLKTAVDVALTRQIVDRSGQPLSSPQASSTLYDGSYPAQYRPRTYWIQNDYADDFKSNVSPYNWSVILSRAREIYANVGAVKNAVNEIADFSVGDSWYPKFYGADEEWGHRAESLLTEWFKVCDVKGQPFDFQTDLKLASIAVDRDGDTLCILTSRDNYPQIQWVPAHRISSRGYNNVMEYGPYIGYPTYNGAIYNSKGRVIAYNILGDARDGSEDYQVSVFDAHLVMEPEYCDQGRGLSGLSAAITDWADYKTIKGFEIRGIKHSSAQSLQMYIPEQFHADLQNEYSDSPYTTTIQQSGSTRNVSIETLQGGETLIFRPDSGAKLEVLKSDRPSQNTAQFLLDHVLRHAFLSLRWPVELSFDLNSRGATTKLVVAKAQRRIESRQMYTIYPVWKRIISYAVAKFIKHGQLPRNNQWWMFEPTFPRNFTLDNYRDIRGDVELYNKALTTGTKIAAAYGYDYYSNLEEKAKELSKAEEIAKKYGLNRNEIITQTLQGNAIAAPETGEEEEDEARVAKSKKPDQEEE